MTEIEKLIRLNVELEGLLKVLADRGSIDARSLLAEKFREYSAGLQALLAEGIPTEGKVSEVVAQAKDLAADANATEVKDQEAVDAEVTDETTAATEAIEKGAGEDAEAEASESAAESADEREEESADDRPHDNSALLEAFTTADRDRFRRELFNSDEDDMDDTMNLLAQMPSYEEAVDYLSNDLLWDSRNAAVGDFYAILKANMHS